MKRLEEKEKEYLDDIREFDRESVRFYSNEYKPLREKKVVKAFLRVIGVDFGGQEVISYRPDPPDVIFGEARFEVVDLLDKDRERHKEFKDRADKSKAASCLADVCHDLHEEPSDRSPIEFAELLGRIEKEVIDKKYKKLKSRKNRIVDFGTLDLLIYVTLKKHYLIPPVKLVCPSDFLTSLRGQGWRSVSFFMEFFAGVFFSKVDAPVFIKNLKGRIIFVEDAMVASSLWQD
jgi:hypothetical protein